MRGGVLVIGRVNYIRPKPYGFGDEAITDIGAVPMDDILEVRKEMSDENEIFI